MAERTTVTLQEALDALDRRIVALEASTGVLELAICYLIASSPDRAGIESRLRDAVRRLAPDLRDAGQSTGEDDPAPGLAAHERRVLLRVLRSLLGESS